MLNTAAYYMAVAGLAAVVLYVSWNMGSWYVNWPTYIKTEIVEQMRADFPAVTVCKLDPCQRGDNQTRNCTGFGLVGIGACTILAPRPIHSNSQPNHEFDK